MVQVFATVAATRQFNRNTDLNENTRSAMRVFGFKGLWRLTIAIGGGICGELG